MRQYLEIVTKHQKFSMVGGENLLAGCLIVRTGLCSLAPLRFRKGDAIGGGALLVVTVALCRRFATNVVRLAWGGGVNPALLFHRYLHVKKSK